MKGFLLGALPFVFFAAASFADVTTERPVSTPVYAPAASTGQIASDGDGFFEVWNDQRDRGAVYASAVTRDGTVRNPSGIFLTKGSPTFAVAWTDGNSASAEDDRSASLVPIGNGRVLAAYTRVAFETPYEGVERAFMTTPRPPRGRAASKGLP